jgi:hypothetical protein
MDFFDCCFLIIAVLFLVLRSREIDQRKKRIKEALDFQAPRIWEREFATKEELKKAGLV